MWEEHFRVSVEFNGNEEDYGSVTLLNFSGRKSGNKIKSILCRNQPIWRQNQIKGAKSSKIQQNNTADESPT